MRRRGSQGEDIIGQWSEDKLELLAKYLKAYAIIMGNQKKKWLSSFHYIDAFAGSIVPILRDEDEERYISGSPLRAIATEPRFDSLWFIDLLPQRIKRLEELKQKFPERLIEIRDGNCNQILKEEIIPSLSRSDRRGIIFLDPYGLQVEWSTVQALAEARTFDIFVNFSIMGLTRQLQRNTLPTQDIRQRINLVMGNSSWVDGIYQLESQLSLFEEQSVSRESLSAEWLASLYAEQLKILFPHVSNPVIMKNSKNSALYALILASPKESAKKIMNDIFSRYERLKGNSGF
ncbi:MAG: three-Cys-motif partner protein TcmP [Synechococcaceae cyanobacterium SM2_3_2]|nr:three-Cys-motif partner protein TcmP [Synechococcaceae cyanobacterium SM2_3_2]